MSNVAVAHGASGAREAGQELALGTAAKVAGWGLLGMAALAVFGVFVAIEALVVPGDAARTASAITEAPMLFRLGTVSLLLIAVLDVVVAWALRPILSRVHHQVSVLAAWMRIAYAVVFFVGIAALVGVPTLAGNGDAGSAEQVMARVDTFYSAWDAGLLLFGLHLLLVGWLVVKAEFAPTWLGALVVLAGVGYTVDALAVVGTGGLSFDLAAFTFMGEPLLAIWLLVRARRLSAL